jgi:hypothetical protein
MIVHSEPVGAMEIGSSGDLSCESGPVTAGAHRRPYERPRILQSLPLTSDEALMDGDG